MMHDKEIIFLVRLNFNKVIWDIYFKKMLPELSKLGSNGDNVFYAVSDTKTLHVSFISFSVYFFVYMLT